MTRASSWMDKEALAPFSMPPRTDHSSHAPPSRSASTPPCSSDRPLWRTVAPPSSSPPPIVPPLRLLCFLFASRRQQFHIASSRATQRARSSAALENKQECFMPEHSQHRTSETGRPAAPRGMHHPSAYVPVRRELALPACGRLVSNVTAPHVKCK